MLHTIHFICPVTANSVSQLQNHCLAALNQGATEINIHISSRGGETDYGFAAYSFLKSLPVTVRTFNLSNVESIANIIFLAGKERFATENSRFLLHPLSWSFGVASIDHSRLSEMSKCLDNDFERFVQILKTEISGDYNWSDIIKSATILTPKEALSHNVINEITTVSLSSGGANWFVSC